MSRLTLQGWIKQIESDIGADELANYLFREEIAKGIIRQASPEMINEYKQKLEWLKELQHYKDLEEQGRLINEEDVLKFYYIDSEDKYVVGQRLDTMYYAEITERFSLAFYMSRYLPWGEHVVDEKSAWKEHTYCSEPREIPFTEWLKGFMEQQAKLAELKGEKDG